MLYISLSSQVHRTVTFNVRQTNPPDGSQFHLTRKLAGRRYVGIAFSLNVLHDAFSSFRYSAEILPVSYVPRVGQRWSWHRYRTVQKCPRETHICGINCDVKVRFPSLSLCDTTKWICEEDCARIGERCIPRGTLHAQLRCARRMGRFFSHVAGTFLPKGQL